jgi:hypothetical protein
LLEVASPLRPLSGYFSPSGVAVLWDSAYATPVASLALIGRGRLAFRGGKKRKMRRGILLLAAMAAVVLVGTGKE